MGQLTSAWLADFPPSSQVPLPALHTLPTCWIRWRMFVWKLTGREEELKRRYRGGLMIVPGQQHCLAARTSLVRYCHLVGQTRRRVGSSMVATGQCQMVSRPVAASGAGPDIARCSTGGCSRLVQGCCLASVLLTQHRLPAHHKFPPHH